MLSGMLNLNYDIKDKTKIGIPKLYNQIYLTVFVSIDWAIIVKVKGVQ